MRTLPLLLVGSIAGTAHADGVKERFRTSVPTDVVEALTCGMHPVASIEGRAHAFDVTVNGLRCSRQPAADGAIPLAVRFRADFVYLDATVPEEIYASDVAPAVKDVRIELQRRLWHTMPIPLRTNPQQIIGGVGMMLLGTAVGIASSLPVLWGTTTHACTDRGCDDPPYGFVGLAVPIILLGAGLIGGGIYLVARGAKARPVPFLW